MSVEPARARVAAVLGTAGHVDHGKTALVRALTGMETDRLPEEQARGISIELGFAWRDSAVGRVAFVDVPGHERFVRQMISGAAGIDAVVLVVAADEGVMPQTREHLAICDLLGVRHGLVVLSRADLVEPDFLALAREDVAALVQGTFLEGAAVEACSVLDPASVARVGAAVDTLVAGLVRRDERDRPFVLAVDRGFSRAGHGTIVTGTSRAGTVAVGDALALIHPRATTMVRVRGLEVHGDAVTQAGPGLRVALNLSGVAAGDVPRGARLTQVGPGAPSVASMWDVRVRARAGLPLALPDGERGLACCGATVVEATLALLDRGELAPGASALAQLRLAEPVVLLPGERWILRGFRELGALGATLGGGIVLAPSPRRRKASGGVAELEALAGFDLAAALRTFVSAAGEGGVDARALHGALPWPRAAIDAAVAASTLVKTAGPHAILVAPDALASLTAALERALEDHHAAEPSSPGLALEALRTRTRPSADATVFAAIVDALVRAGTLARNGAVLARAGFTASTSGHDDQLDAALLAELEGAGLSPPRIEDLTTARADLAAIERAIVRLVARGVVARVMKDMVFATSALATFEARVRSYFEREPWLDAQALKELTGVTRKWLIPLGEWLDRARVTVRVGDRRRLRA